MNYKSTPVYNSMKSGKQYVNKRINREIEITKKIQTEILERKNTRNEITNAVQNIHGRLDQEKEITSASRQAFEITESKEKK